MDALCVESVQALELLAEEFPPARASAATEVYGDAAAELVVGWRTEVEMLAVPAELEPAVADLGMALGGLEFVIRSVAAAPGGSAGEVETTIGELDAAIEGLGLTECGPLELRVFS